MIDFLFKYKSEALRNLLIKKGLITEKEFIEEICDLLGTKKF